MLAVVSPVTRLVERLKSQLRPVYGLWESMWTTKTTKPSPNPVQIYIMYRYDQLCQDTKNPPNFLEYK